MKHSDDHRGVAALIETAEAFARRGGRQLDLVFVGYDAEEIGLLGGYDWLRRHVVVAGEPVLGWVHFESPGGPPELCSLVDTNAEAIARVLEDTGTGALYTSHIPLETLPARAGGIIPTDIQGMYWYGLHGFFAGCSSPYYHTAEDTPDKLDIAWLTDVVLHYEDAIGALDAGPTDSLLVRDPFIWSVTGEWSMTGDLQPAPDGLRVELRVSDAAGTPQAGVTVKLWLDVDDFTRVYTAQATTDAAGYARWSCPAPRWPRAPAIAGSTRRQA